MSHSSAEFHFADGTILFGEYNGTVDIMCTGMFKNPEDRDEAWREQVWSRCNCGRPAEPCIAVVTFGEPWGWQGAACRHCMLFTGPHSPYDVENFEGKPAIDAAVERLKSSDAAPRF